MSTIALPGDLVSTNFMNMKRGNPVVRPLRGYGAVSINP